MVTSANPEMLGRKQLLHQVFYFLLITLLNPMGPDEIDYLIPGNVIGLQVFQSCRYAFIIMCNKA